jgi:glycosyltransferase involved in cell wall biosynthesis
MRIVFCYQYCTMGGCETVLSTRMHELRAQGIDAWALFLHGGAGERLFRKLPDRVRICPRSSAVKETLWALRPDFLLSLDTPQIRPYLQRLLPETRYVYEVHTSDPEDLQRLKNQCWQGVSAILTPTRAHSALILSLLRGKIRCPVTAIPNPLPPDFSGRLPTPRYRRPIVVWVGRLNPLKNWRMFLEICGRLNAAGAEMEYWIVGTSPDLSREKARLWEEIKKAKLAGRLRWLPYVPYEKMARLYRFAGESGGCLVYTSHLESFGMAAAEAMACSCPVVVPDFGGFRDFVIPEVTGYCYPPGNVPAAATCVKKIVGDLSTRSRIITAGYQRVQYEYSARNAVSQLLAVLQELEVRRSESDISIPSS